MRIVFNVFSFPVRNPDSGYILVAQECIKDIMCDKIEEINILGNISNFIVFDSEQKKVDKKKNTVYIHFLTEFSQSIER